MDLTLIKDRNASGQRESSGVAALGGGAGEASCGQNHISRTPYLISAPGRCEEGFRGVCTGLESLMERVINQHCEQISGLDMILSRPWLGVPSLFCSRDETEFDRCAMLLGALERPRVRDHSLEG
ncbi:unnamed protein product [Arctogadus glacialis]